MSDNQIEYKITKIKTIFDIEEIINTNAADTNEIAKYYKTNKLAYRIFHNQEGFIHMGISNDNKYSKNDLYEQANIIQTYFDTNTTKVLELGCGKGKNLEYLARGQQDISFQGIDLQDGQTDIAINKSKNYENMSVKYGNFHDLSSFKPNSFDLVFAIEAICHSTNKVKIANEVSRILKPNGKFIIFDGYLNRPIESLSNNQQIACHLVEKGMSVERFEKYQSFKEAMVSNGFNLINEIDYSKNILPTLYNFERIASMFFKYSKLSKLITKVFPINFTKNALSGYLMPDLINNNIAKYYLTVFQKKD